MRRERLVYLALALMTAGVFWPVVYCQFINLDDWMYVTANGPVREGLTQRGVGWAFMSMVSSNWHPLTWLSHMLDCQLFGLNASAHHVVNVVFHTANTLLLFHLLRRMTVEFWPSVLVAALFAVHPLHVESVAWISERKDVLSTLFGLLSLWAYVSYTQKGNRGQVPGIRRWPARGYWLALLFFALSLMCKPMLVTWPFVLLLLDFWPLGRFPNLELLLQGEKRQVNQPSTLNPSARRSEAETAQPSTPARLVLEKLPFLALSIAACVLAIIAQRIGGSVISMNRIVLSQRIDNALVSYVSYLSKTFWPKNLAAFYPHPFQWPDAQVLLSGAVLVVITLAVLSAGRRNHYLIFGWLWFLGTLVPVIGLVQVGAQAMADRYMYIPSIGLFMMIVWALKDIAGRMRLSAVSIGVVGAVVLAACMFVTSRQVRYWESSETLFGHALAVTKNNMPAEFLYGDALIKNRKVEQGLEHLANAVRLNPSYAAAHAKMADILARRGMFRESIEHYYAILRTQPNELTVLNNLAWMLATNPNPEVRDGVEAVRLAEHACEVSNYRIAICVGTLAAAYAEAGRFPDAVRMAEKARTLALGSGNKELAEKNTALLRLYLEGRPCREFPAGPVVATERQDSP